MSTIFSKIIAGEAQADIVYRDELVTCFRDIAPSAPVHVLIVPNREIPTVNDFTEEDAPLIAHMVFTAQKIARSEGIAESGYRLVWNVNEEGGQVVYHVHLHLMGGRHLSGHGRTSG
jgi:histidine triad (HIT) family protein